MDVTINIKPEHTSGLLAQAQAEGLSLEQFLARKVETLVPSNLPPSSASFPHDSEQWENGLDAWLDSFPQQPLLSHEALQRENWYPDRW